MAKRQKTAAEIAAAWDSAMRSSQTQTAYRNGIAGFQGNPMEMAASDTAMQDYVNGVQASVNSGKRRQSLMDTPVSTWRDNATNTGAAALSTGATKAKQKMLARMQKWAPIYAQASAAAQAVPKADWLERVRVSNQTLIDAKGK